MEDIDTIIGMAEKFYNKLLGTQAMMFTEEHDARLQQLIPHYISAESGLLLEREIKSGWQKPVGLHTW